MSNRPHMEAFRKGHITRSEMHQIRLLRLLDREPLHRRLLASMTREQEQIHAR